MKFNKAKSKVLPLGRNNPRHQDTPWAHARGPFPPLPSCDSVIFWAHARFKDSAVRSMGWWGWEHGRQRGSVERVQRGAEPV